MMGSRGQVSWRHGRSFPNALTRGLPSSSCPLQPASNHLGGTEGSQGGPFSMRL